MTVKLKNLFALLASVLLPMLAASEQSTHAVKVAVNLPLSGELAVFGIPIQRGFSLAQEEIQKLSEPFTINVDWQDNHASAAQAVSIAAVQSAQSPDIYVSGLKPQTLAIVDRITKLGVPHFIWAWDTHIDQVAPTAVRTWLNFSLEASAIHRYAERKKPTRVAILYAQIPGNTEAHYRQVVAPDLKLGGVSEVLVESYSLDQVDFRTTVLKLSQFKPDLYIINGFPHQLVSLVRSLRQMNLLSPGNTFASMDILDAAGALSPEELNGVVTAAPQFMVSETAEYHDWKNRYKKRFGESPSYHAAFGYDEAYIIYDAARRQRPSVSLRDAILRTDRKGITGQLRFDSSGSLIVSAVPAVFDRNGKLNLIAN